MAYHPGYPASNDSYDPYKAESGNKDNHLINGPRFDPEDPAQKTGVVFHELGHAHLFTKFAGETEAAVNILGVAVQNVAFDVDLDRAAGLYAKVEASGECLVPAAFAMARVAGARGEIAEQRRVPRAELIPGLVRGHAHQHAQVRVRR